MVNISKVDTQLNIWYLSSKYNHVMLTNGKVSQQVIIILIIVPLALKAGTFLPLLHILLLLKNFWLNKTEKQ